MSVGAGFLFGNVDSNNQVEADDGPLDQATRQALAQLPSELLGASTLLGDEEGGSNVDTKTAPMEKARDAQDFSGERELAEEVTLSTSLQKPVTLDTDDYDAPMDKPAPSAAPIASTPAPAPSVKRKEPEIILPPMPINLNNIRFSDMFIAPPPKDAAARRKNRQSQQAPAVKPVRSLVASAADLELDESELLLTNITTAPPTTQRSQESFSLLPEGEAQFEEEEEDGDAPALGVAKGVALVAPPEPAFLPVQQLDWENDIIWSDSDVPQPQPEADAMPSSAAAVAASAAADAAANNKKATELKKEKPDTPKRPSSGAPAANGGDAVFEDVEAMIEKEEAGEKEREPGETDSEADKEKEVAKERAEAERLAAAESVDAKRRRRTFKNVNEQLADGGWASAIAWGPSEARRLKAPLVLDMNDRYLLFEEMAHGADAAGPAGGKRDAASQDNAPAQVRPKAVRKLSKSGLEVEPDLPRTQTSSYSSESRNAPLDPFNISLDRFYATTRAKSSAAAMAARAPIQHAVPALKLSLVKTHLVKEDLVDFHRPKVDLSADGIALKILLPDPPKTVPSTLAVGEAPILKKKSDLSARDGRVVLMEYLEEYPPFVQNVGMASRVVAYWRRPRDPSQAPSAPPKFPDGETVTLEPGDPSPFLGDVTSERPVQAMENKLFKAPIVPHTPAPTDFLLIRNKHSNKVYVREVAATYVVGQLQPGQEVPAPNSRTANIYVRNRLQGFIFRLFKKKSNLQHRLRIADLCSAFPNHSETSIRKRLKECADFQRAGDDSGWWTVKEQFQLPTEEELRAMLTPEMTCAFESMLVGHQRLQDYGIDRITTLPGLTTAIQQLDQMGNRSMSEKARMIEEQLKLTPWNLTNSFLSAVSGRAQLQLTGAGDPTGRGEAFSFLRASQKPAAPKPKGPPGPKVVVTGTDADLRKLSLEQARQILLKFGIPDERVQGLTRWDRIALIRKMSSEAAAAGDEAGLTKFARGSRYTAHLAHQQYKDHIQAIFQQQLSLLARRDEEASDNEKEEAEDAQLAELEKNLETDLLRTQNVDEREDEAELERLRNENRDLATSPVAQPGGGGGKARGGSLTSPPDTPSAATGDGGSQGPPRKKVQYLKRTVTTRNADGTETKKVEIIKDQSIVQAYLAKQSTALEGLRKLKTHLTADEEDQKNRVRKERRRLQEQLRRLRRNAEKQAANREKLAAGELDSAQSALLLKCGACGMVGHMRTNRNCPLYEEPKKGGAPATPAPRVVREPTSPAVVLTPAPPSVKVETTGTKLKLLRKPDASATPAGGATAAAGGEGKVRIVVRKDLVASLGGSGGGSASKKRSRGGDKHNDGDEAFDAEDEFVERSRQQGGRRRKAESVELANRIEQLWHEVKDNPWAAAFLKPVNPKHAPDYHRVVARPVDLSTMRDRIRSFAYQGVDDFLADMRLMASNCHLYCDTRFPYLPPQADALLAFAEQRGAALKARLATEQDEDAGEDDEGEDASAAPPESPHHGVVIEHNPSPPQPQHQQQTITNAPPMLPVALEDIKPVVRDAPMQM